jgi:RNA polymerase sigma-70 factor (ECF subfamily)
VSVTPFYETLAETHLDDLKKYCPFLIRVARNLWIDHFRTRQWRRRKMLLQHLPVYYSDPDYVEVRNLVEWMAERLPRRNIEMLLLSEYFGYTMQEIADTLGYTVPAVKSVLFRARERLRRFKYGQKKEGEEREVIGLDVERWLRAILQDRPQCIWMEL